MVMMDGKKLQPHLELIAFNNTQFVVVVNGLKWSQTIPNRFKWFQMSQMVSNSLKWPQMSQNLPNG